MNTSTSLSTNQEVGIKKYGAWRKRIIFFAAFLSLSSIPYTPHPFLAYAVEGLKIVPAVIDEKAYARDILKKDITLTNESARKMNLYLSVNNIDSQEGKTEFLDYQSADKSTSLANWIEVSRGVIELGPGEGRTIPLEIRVDPGALGGEYHAVLSLAEGSTRAEAEADLSRATTMLINLEILENIREKLDLEKFISDKVFFLSSPVTFSYVLENVGNRRVAMSGEIIIYDRRGNEAGALPINSGREYIDPGAQVEFTGVWEGEPKMGRYKAHLSLEYGNIDKGTLTDTVFFWVIPLPFIVLFVGIAIAVAGFAWFAYSRYEKKYHRLHELVRAHMDAPRPSEEGGGTERSGANVGSAETIGLNVANKPINDPVPLPVNPAPAVQDTQIVVKDISPKTSPAVSRSPERRKVSDIVHRKDI